MKWLVLVLCLVGFSVHSKPIAQMTDGQVTVTVTDEPCKLMSLVTNLQGRATWTEKGKTTEGCYGINGQIAIFYWEVDKTVSILNLGHFQRVHMI